MDETGVAPDISAVERMVRVLAARLGWEFCPENRHLITPDQAWRFDCHDCDREKREIARGNTPPK